MADPTFLGGDDGVNNTLPIATQFAIQARKVLARQAAGAATMMYRTWPPTVLLDMVRALPDRDLAHLIELAREFQSQEQFDEVIHKQAPASLVGLLSKRENRAELYDILRTVAMVVTAGAAVTTCTAAVIREKPPIIQQAPPAVPPQRPLPPTEKL